MHLNGARVGADYFTPGWTDYAERLQYQVFDISDLVTEGDNRFVALLAEGWYAGYVGFVGTREHYGDRPQLLAEIEVDTAAGRVVYCTGGDWTAGTGPVVTSDMLMGEDQDLRRAVVTDGTVSVTEGTPAPRLGQPGPARARPRGAVARGCHPGRPRHAQDRSRPEHHRLVASAPAGRAGHHG